MEDGGLARARVLPGGDVGEVLVVALASPSSVWLSVRKWPPQLSVRCSASRHMSSASSRKSATRPAFSSDWFSVAAEPGTLTPLQNSRRSSGMRSSALRSPSSDRSIPQ